MVGDDRSVKKVRFWIKNGESCWSSANFKANTAPHGYFAGLNLVWVCFDNIHVITW
jgi:hypothetical protein